VTAYQLVTSANKKSAIERLDDKVLSWTGLSKQEMMAKIDLEKDQPDYIVLKDKIPRDDALLLKSRLSGLDQFEVTQTYLRNYPEQSLNNILGYLGKVSRSEAENNPTVLINRYSGKSGLEKFYDADLQGEPGYRRGEVDASGRIMRSLKTVESQEGRNVYLTLDKNLQQYVASLVSQKTNELKTQGTAIVMNPQDGGILAMVSTPSYDSNAISAGLSQEDYQKLVNDPNKPLFNRAISGTYPPGSSIKPFIASEGLAEGVVNESVAFDTPPAIEIGQWRFPDWKDHGVTNIKRAISESNNIFFFAIGGGYGPVKSGLGPDGIKEGLEKFGYGDKTGIDLVSESSGFIPTPEWKKKTTKENWFIGNTYNMAIGQGDLLITPIQMANATSVIANAGKLFKPHFVREISASSTEPRIEYKTDDFLLKKDIYSSHDLDIVKTGMRMTITEGSAHSVFGDGFPVEVCGKTGTAQFGNEEKTHAWFSSFAPCNDSKIVVTVLIEGGGEGYQIAAPIAKQIYQWWNDNRN
jgi:penicillin-binding protein 2